MRVLVLLLLLAGCARPLTPGERDFAGHFFGPETVDRTTTFQPVAVVGALSRTYAARPRTTCREKILPPLEGPTFEARTAGITLYNHVVTSPDWYLEDYLAGWPEELDLVAAMFFAHEMTHVWQWRNRQITRFTPLRAGLEHVVSDDPYLFETDGRRFEDYGYEQQASLVEEYICCQTLDPEGARTARLRALVGAALPLQELPRVRDVRVPYSGALGGICS